MNGPHPLGPDAPKEDYVGLAFRALAFSIAFGVTLVALVTWSVRTMQLSSSAPEPGLGNKSAVLLLGGLTVGLLAAGAATWRLLAPIRNPYRQGMLAVVSVFATFLFGLLTQPVDLSLGRSGLLGLALVSLLVCLWLGRGLRRAR